MINAPYIVIDKRGYQGPLSPTDFVLMMFRESITTLVTEPAYSSMYTSNKFEHIVRLDMLDSLAEYIPEHPEVYGTGVKSITFAFLLYATGVQFRVTKSDGSVIDVVVFINQELYVSEFLTIFSKHLDKPISWEDMTLQMDRLMASRCEYLFAAE